MFTGIWYGPIMCKVESSTRVHPGGVPEDPPEDHGKWVYSLKAMDWGDEYAFPAGEQTDLGFETETALNLWELGNDTSTQYGIPVESLPGTFELKPVPNGAYVMAWTSTAKPDTQEFNLVVFQYPNQFDGTCIDEETP